MVEVPRHVDQREHAARLPLLTERATVTLTEPMDRSRNRRVVDAIQEHLVAVGHPDALDGVKHGSDYDWETLWDLLDESGIPSERWEALRTLVDRFERPYPSLLRLRVRPDVDLEFAPGQYVTLRARGTPRAYSIANSPTAEELEFAIRRVPGGRLTSNLFTHVREGEEVVVRGPNGDMVLESPSPRDVVFLSTGTGVAPFKSMIDYLFERGWDEHAGRERQIWLFQGCAWADDLPYRESFERLASERENFHFVPTLTRESLMTDWDGESDYVQQVFLKHLADGALDGVELPSRLEPFRDADPVSGVDARIDPNRVDVYACGVTAMVEMLVRAATAAGVPEKRLEYEGFG